MVIILHCPDLFCLATDGDSFCYVNQLAMYYLTSGSGIRFMQHLHSR